MRRDRGYKEDSTKGLALMHQPKTYKGDVLAQAWLDSRVLATLGQWLDKNGYNTRFMSEVIRETLKIIVDHIVENKEIEMVDDTVEAREMLVRKYRFDLNPSGRGLKNAHHNMLLSERRRELKGNVGAGGYDVDVPMKKGKTFFTEDEIDKLTKIYNQRVTDQRDKRKEEELKKHKEEMKYDDDGICVQEPRTDGIVTKGDIDQWNKEKSESDKEKDDIPKDSDVPRKLTEEELDERAVKREIKDREQAEAFKEM